MKLEQVRSHTQKSNELLQCLQKMEELREKSNLDGVSIDNTAYQECQTHAKQLVKELADKVETLVDESGTYEKILETDEEGNPTSTDTVNLPEPAVDKVRDTKLPEKPQQKSKVKKGR